MTHRNYNRDEFMCVVFILVKIRISGKRRSSSAKEDKKEKKIAKNSWELFIQSVLTVWYSQKCIYIIDEFSFAHGKLRTVNKRQQKQQNKKKRKRQKKKKNTKDAPFSGVKCVRLSFSFIWDFSYARTLTVKIILFFNCRVLCGAIFTHRRETRKHDQTSTERTKE